MQMNFSCNRGITTALVLEIARRTDGFVDYPDFYALVTAPDGELLQGWVHGSYFACPKPALTKTPRRTP